MCCERLLTIKEHLHENHVPRCSHVLQYLHAVLLSIEEVSEIFGAARQRRRVDSIVVLVDQLSRHRGEGGRHAAAHDCRNNNNSNNNMYFFYSTIPTVSLLMMLYSIILINKKY